MRRWLPKSVQAALGNRWFDDDAVPINSEIEDLQELDALVGELRGHYRELHYQGQLKLSGKQQTRGFATGFHPPWRAVLATGMLISIVGIWFLKPAGMEKPSPTSLHQGKLNPTTGLSFDGLPGLKPGVLALNSKLKQEFMVGIGRPSSIQLAHGVAFRLPPRPRPVWRSGSPWTTI